MNDVAIDFRALPVLDHTREQYHKDVRSFQAHRVIDTRRRLRMWFWVAIVSLAMVAILSSAVAGLIPLKTLVPEFLVVREDGTVDTGISLSDLGVDMAQKVIRASVWRYVSERESYSFSDARHRYELVSLMSSQDVQRDYQSWFLKADDSPQKKIGKRGQASVREISMSPLRDGVFLVRFWKITQLYGEQEHKSSETATVEYELLHQAPASLILDDPAAIRVTRYQVEENSAQ
jgi:type IV secretion system protein VirB8